MKGVFCKMGARKLETVKSRPSRWRPIPKRRVRLGGSRRLKGFGLGFGWKLGVNQGPPTAYAPVAGDIIAARVLASGWVLELDIHGFKPGGNVNRGRDTNGDYPGTGGVTVGYDLDPLGTPKVVVNYGGRSGYDATTAAAATITGETTAGTISLRKAYSAGGDEQTNDETDNTTYVTVRCALMHGIEAGVSVTVDVLADMYRDNGTGGSGAQSRAVTGLAVTNNSTWTIPKPTCAYLTPARQFLRLDQDFEFGVEHFKGRNARMVAGVVMTWTGATSGVTISKTVTSMTLSGFFDASMPRVQVFKATLTTAEIATFTQGETVNWSVEARPFVGPAFASLTDGTAWPTTRMQQSIPFVCDKDNALRTFATVDPAGALSSASTAGCGTTDTEQTNTANCYSSINAALAAIRTFNGGTRIEGAVIYLRAGTYANFGAITTTAYTAGVGWVTITRAPSTTSRADVVISSTAGQTITANTRRMGGNLRFKDVTLQSVATATTNDNVIIHGPDSTATPSAAIWIDGCRLQSQSSAATPSAMINQYGEQYWTNNTASGKLRMTLASGRGFNLVGGNDFDGCGDIDVAGPFVGNKGRGNTQFSAFISGTANVILPDQIFWCFNEYHGADPISIAWHTTATAQSYPKGVARVCNLVENFANATEAASPISADSDINPMEWASDAYMTIVGERTNWLYNDIGTASVSKRGAMFASVCYQRFIKRDTFSHPVNGKQAARTGNWWASHGVESRAVVTLASQFGFTKCASNSEIGDYVPGGVFVATPAFTSDLSGSAGAGSGDYHVGVSSDLIGLVPAGMERLPYYLDGAARPNDGTSVAGALGPA